MMNRDMSVDVYRIDGAVTRIRYRDVRSIGEEAGIPSLSCKVISSPKKMYSVFFVFLATVVAV